MVGLRVLLPHHHHHQIHFTLLLSTASVTSTGRSGRISKVQTSHIEGREFDSWARIKLMIYNIDTCCYVVWRSELLGYGNDWLAQFQDNLPQ